MSDPSNCGVLVLGDSHAKSFFQQGHVPEIPGQNISIYGAAINAASVTGFGRMRSSLNLNTRVREQIEQHRDMCQHVVFALGQVDVELGLYYRWVVKDEMVDPEVLFAEIIDLYINNINDMCGGLQPTIKGINQTVLKKQSHARYYASRIIIEKDHYLKQIAPLKARLRAVYPSYDVRLTISNMFNEILARAAQKADIPYFDINDSIVDKETGEVADAFCPNFSDHHIVNSVETHKLHIKHLKAAISSRSGPHD